MLTSSTTTTFTNCKICRGSELVEDEEIVVADDTGRIVHAKSAVANKVIDFNGAILAPGLIELQTNGMRGFHFTHFENDQDYAQKLIDVAQYLPSTVCTAFYATIPTVSSDDFKKILPSLEPREIPNAASLLGAHAEGPYLHPSKKGAHNASLFHQASILPEEVYGTTAESNHVLKLVTLAPELEHSTKLIENLTARNIRVSLGHSAASHSQGLAALSAGATCLTHTLNAMAPLHHRDPGLAGLVTNSPMNSMQGPYFSIIPDGNHLHASVATMLFRANPSTCIIITDSIELAGLEDGTYPGHAQIPFNQTKKGTKVVIEGTETLIGGCAGLGECVKNVMTWSGCGVAEAVRCASENVADLMGDEGRGKLEIGRRADFVVLDDEGQVSQTWILGKKVWESK